VCRHLAASLCDGSAFGQSDPQTAAAWYLTSARNGEARVVSRYIRLMARANPTAEQCRAAISMLDPASRTGDMNATLSAIPQRTSKLTKPAG
jgi:hypothetical protein